MNNQSFIGQDVWDARNDGLDLRSGKCDFDDLFEKYLPEGGSCFEVGCYPGRILMHLGKRFGYTVSGIDLTPHVKDRLRKKILENGIELGTLIHGDFFSFHSRDVYDIVCSFGFVEHFADVEDVLVRHIRLVKPGGILVISCPNFRKLQYVLHRCLDRKNLMEHNRDAMDLGKWRDVLVRHNMKIIHHGYYGTAGFWVEHEPGIKSIARRSLGKVLSIAMQGIDRVTDLPNPVISPYMISFSKKKLWQKDRRTEVL